MMRAIYFRGDAMISVFYPWGESPPKPPKRKNWGNFFGWRSKKVGKNCRQKLSIFSIVGYSDLGSKNQKLGGVNIYCFILAIETPEPTTTPTGIFF